MTRRARRTSLAVVVLLAVAFAAYVGWRAWQVKGDLDAAVTDAAGLEAGLRTGDDAATQQALDGLSDHAGHAADVTSGPTWSLLGHLPAVGDDARGVRAVSGAVADLAGPQGLQPLVASAGRLDGLLPSGGRIDIDGLAALRDPVAQGAQALGDAQARLGAEDPDGFVDRLGTQYVDLQQRISEARRGLGAADTALQVMPSMLGADRARSYLLVFQNNAEVRATGGTPGAVSVLTANDGGLALGEQAPASMLGSPPGQSPPVTAAEEAIYSPVLSAYFLDATMTPDFPRAADLMRQHWEQLHPEDTIDGVLSIDPVALSYLLRATGPVDVDGTQLTSDNAVDELLHNTYLRLADPRAQDAFFASAARAVFEQLVSGTAAPQQLLTELALGAGEHRVLVHSFDTGEQQVIAPTQVSGVLVTDPAAAPQVGVYLNDATGSKMSYYLRTDVDVRATSCTGGVQTYTGTATLTSTAPPDVATQPDYVTGGGAYGVDPGRELLFLRVHGPVGGTVTDSKVLGKPAKPDVVDQDGRPVISLIIQLDPGQSVDATWTMTSGQGQTGDTVVSVTPGVDPGDASSVSRSGC